jgi:hypothetical protein
MSSIAKRVSLADLAEEDILISGDSLKSWVEACGLTPEQVVEQLTSWLDELEAIPARSVQPDTKLAQAINIYVAGLPHVQSYLERSLSPAAFAEIDTEVRRRESVAELRFKGSNVWKTDAEKRWREAAQARLNEITEDLSRSAWEGDTCSRRGGLSAAIIA